MNHDRHNHCDHEMAYCVRCDVAYCKKCSREWGQYKTNWQWQQSGPYYYGTTTFTTPNTSMQGTTYSLGAHEHK